MTDTQHEGSFYVTVESQDLFSKCYPDIVQAFYASTQETKKKTKGTDIQYLQNYLQVTYLQIV